MTVREGNLHIKYSCTVCTIDTDDKVLYELAEEIGDDWKELAVQFGMKLREIKIIELETQTPKQQACEMLCQFRSKKGNDLNIRRVKKELQRIRKKKQTKQSRSQ